MTTDESKFVNSANMTILDVKEKYGFTHIHLHGRSDEPTVKEGEKHLFAYDCYSLDPSCHIPTGLTPEIEVLDYRPRANMFDMGHCYNVTSYFSIAIRVLKNQNGSLIGYTDFLGNVSLIDFFHHDEPFPLGVVLDYLTNGNRIGVSFDEKLYNLINQSRGIKIEKLVVVGKYDEEEYKRETVRKVDEVKEYFEKKYEQMIKVISSGYSTALADMTGPKELLQGLALATECQKKKIKLSIRGTTLVLKMKIIPKRVYKESEMYDLPEGHGFYAEDFTIDLSSKELKVECERHFHPNIGSSLVCLGDNKRKSLQEIVLGLRELLETMNLSDPHSNDATGKAKSILQDLIDSKKAGHVFGIEVMS